MPCPTCNQILHGIDHGAAIAIVQEMIDRAENSKAIVNNKPVISMIAAAVLGALADVKATLEKRNPREFWCPNCGTVRTVTGDFISDQPPRLVERVKAADDGQREIWQVLKETAGSNIAIRTGAWAGIRRCIGRDK